MDRHGHTGGALARANALVARTQDLAYDPDANTASLTHAKRMQCKVATSRASSANATTLLGSIRP